VEANIPDMAFEDYNIMHQKVLEGEVRLFPVDAKAHNGDDDNEYVIISEGRSQVVSEEDRKALERGGGHGPSLFHVDKNFPKEELARAPATKMPAGDAGALAAIDKAGATPTR
jgi:hypothetical protein